MPALDLHSLTTAVIGCDRRIVAQAIRLPRICGAFSSSITIDLDKIEYYFFLLEKKNDQINQIEFFFVKFEINHLS